MIRLFSRFDIHFFNIITLSFFVLIFFMFNYIFRGGFVNLNKKRFVIIMAELINSFVPFRVSQGTLPLVISVFFTMVVINLFRVNSFNFPMGSQISVVMFLGLSLWLSFTIFATVKNYIGAIAHLIPEGAPIYMAVALIVIELVRLIIRPLTLRVRIMANILAGHLLMILLSSLVFKLQLSGLFYVGLNMIEIFVALIQSYIFTVILTLYYRDAK